MSKLFDELVARPDAATDVMRHLDPGNASDRRQIVDALDNLVSRFIAPAASLLVVAPDGTAYFDPTKTADADFPLMVADVLREDFPALQEPPADQLLARPLQEYGVAITTPQKRRDFFRAWTAQRAGYLVRDLLRFLEAGGRASPADDTAELDRLKRLTGAPLPTLERQLLKHTVARRSGTA